MKRFRFLIGALVATIAIFAVPTHNAGAQMMGTPNLTGTYSIQATGDTLMVGNVRLTQQGSKVVGSGKTKSGGVLQFSGDLTNLKLSGTWRGPTNETGWLTINFNQNGRGFSGEWGYHGRSPNGNIVGTRRT
jgi:hypothetical protein